MRATLIGIGLAVLLPAGIGMAQEVVKPAAGLYLRGEAGYFWSRPAGIGDKAYWEGPNCVICSADSLNDVGNGGMVGGGLGWRFNDWLRAEATFTYRGGMQLTGRNSTGRSHRSDISSTAGMVNLLVDSPWRLGPLQPFAGAGIGVARNTMGRITTSTFFSSTPVGVNAPGGSKTGFAWQATAGLAWPITANLTAELAYRYVDLGKLGTSTGSTEYTYGAIVASPSITNGVEGNLRGQEAVLGLRWSF